MDPFATLGIARSYDVDLRALERKHRELSGVLHPDRYVGTTASERREALERAVALNEAWRIVRDPIRRAEALLALHGLATGEGHEPAAEPEFLMEMLERREALAEAKGARDGARTRALGEGVVALSAQTEGELASALAAGRLEPLPSLLCRLRFYRRFLDEVSTIEDELV
jgi:molecular chaperone HscB